MDENIHYDGEVKAKKIEGVELKFAKPLEDFLLKYTGDEKSIETEFETNELNGTFVSDDFKAGKLNIETKRAIVLREFVELPDELKNSEVKVNVTAPIKFDDLKSIEVNVKVDSNVVNIDAEVEYGKNIEINAKVDIVEKSLLKAYSEDVKWGTLATLDMYALIYDDNLTLDVKNKHLSIETKYGFGDDNIDGNINMSGLKISVKGIVKEEIVIHTQFKSIKKLNHTIGTFYNLEESLPLEGSLDINVIVNELKSAKMKVYARKLFYKPDKKTTHTVENLDIAIRGDAQNIFLDAYSVHYEDTHYFSTKMAEITIDEKIKVSNLWINDALEINGNYVLKTKKGTFNINAKKFQIKDKLANIDAQVDIKVLLDNNDTQVKGNILLLNGSISPPVGGGNFSTDSDIVIIQEMSKKKNSAFMDNLSLMLMIGTKKPLDITQNPMKLKLKPDFTINKDKGSDIFYFGSVDLLEGGTYIFQDKRFVLKKSAVYFTGNVDKPLLDIKATYKSLNHLITIAVTGTPEEPNINFSSSPSLSREEILSVILFDSELGGDTHSGEEMMKMMGGAMAKAALADAGIAVDHLAFGEGNSVEVGKKLSNKITVIYISGVVPKVKLKYQHGKRTESVIGASEESQSYDIIYKRDF
jgi:translocation and assembly module TamB